MTSTYTGLNNNEFCCYVFIYFETQTYSHLVTITIRSHPCHYFCKNIFGLDGSITLLKSYSNKKFYLKEYRFNFQMRSGRTQRNDRSCQLDITVIESEAEQAKRKFDKTKHQKGKSYKDAGETENFQNMRKFIVKPNDLWSSGPSQPLIVFVNPKSGGNKVT